MDLHNNCLPVFDGHNDVLLRIFPPDSSESLPFIEGNDGTNIDLPRARAGGFAGGMFAIFVPNGKVKPITERLTRTGDSFRVEMMPPVGLPYAQAVTNSVMARLFRLEASAPDKIKIVRNGAELDACLEGGPLAVVLHFEGAEAIDTDLNALHVYYEAGLRSLGLVWSRPNAFGSGVPFGYPLSPDTGLGLTDAGKALVKACNRLGILIDLAHINERGFWDVAKTSTAPLVDTHTAAHSLCPSARNLTDKQLDAVGESGGVVGVTFFVGDTRPDGKWERDTPVDVIANQIDYIANRIGIDHVAFGSDYDGATMPYALADVAGLPALVAALRARGYDDSALRKVAFENWRRVLRQTWHE